MSSRVPPSVVALAGALLLAACAPSMPSAPPAVSSGPTAAASTAAPSSAVGPTPASSAAAPTLACVAPADPTTAQTEGPYYTPGAPERDDLVEEGMPGAVLIVTGWVVDTACEPLADATIDVWQADAGGVYDNEGYRLRGVTRTDADGRYAFRTVVPGQYPGRTEHIHVKVTPAGGRTLTSQIYFPGSTTNEGDNIFSPDLLLDIVEAADGLAATFTFVVEP
jgi:protocatechuate 3,4-dioxygenase beta subunit